MSDFNKKVLSYATEVLSEVIRETDKSGKEYISAKVHILINSIIAPTIEFNKIKEDIK